MVNNTSSLTINKTPNEVAYGFAPSRLFNLIEALFFPNILAAQADAAEAISFALINQKLVYNRKHQLLFMKVDKWALLQLYKKYCILAIVGVIKKLTQQYVGFFYILEKFARLVYRLNIPANWKIHPVFSIAQLKPALNPA